MKNIHVLLIAILITSCTTPKYEHIGQEIIDTYAKGYIDGVAKNKITAEKYYNETFKTESNGK
jgi:hypothetical protein